MDTKYQVLVKDEDWEKGTISHLEITAGRVRLEPVHALMDEITFQGVVPGGVAVGRDRLYLISPLPTTAPSWNWNAVSRV